MDPAYEYASGLTVDTEITGKKPQRKTFPKRDQIAAELIAFARCIRDGREPEPSGEEGLADLYVLEAIQRATETGRIEPIGGSRAARGRPRRRASVANRTGCPTWFMRSRPAATDAGGH